MKEEGEEQQWACKHVQSVEYRCRRCRLGLCHNCLNSGHKDHNTEKLESWRLRAMKEYWRLADELTEALAEGKISAQETHLETVLNDVERRITKEYDKLLEAITSVQDEHVDTIRASPFVEKLHQEKAELEGDELELLRAFDLRLGQTITKLLTALAEDNYEPIQSLLTEEMTEEFVNKARNFDPYYQKQKLFMHHLSLLKKVQPRLNHNPRLVRRLVRVLGVHEDPLRLFAPAPTADAVFLFLPKDLIVVKQPAADCPPLKHFALTVLDDALLFVCGGRLGSQYSTAVSVYSEEEGKFRGRTGLLWPRASHGITNRKDIEVYVAGGRDPTGCLASAEVYDVLNNSWKPLPSLSERKRGLALCVCGDRFVYSIGGYDQDELTTIEMLCVIDPVEWERKKLSGDQLSLKYGWHKAAACQVGPAEILVFGGKVTGRAVSSCACYNVETGELWPRSSLPQASSFAGADVRVIDSRIYACVPRPTAVYAYHVLNDFWLLTNEKNFSLVNR